MSKTTFAKCRTAGWAACSLAAAWMMAVPAWADLKINEVYPNMTGSDDMEFIELYNTDLVNDVSLDGYAIIEINGGLSFSNDIGDVEDIAILDGFTIPAGGYFVYGDPGTPNVDLEGFDQSFGLTNETCTFLLVRYTQEVLEADPPADNGLFNVDVDDDCIEDFELGDIVDSVALIDIDETDCTYFGAPVFGPDVLGLFYPAGVVRNNDGVDTDTPDDFCELSFNRDGSDGGRVPSPGESAGTNICSAPFAESGLSLTGVGLPVDIELMGDVPGTPFTAFRIIALPANGTLTDIGTGDLITADELPYVLTVIDDGSPITPDDMVTYEPTVGFSGLDTFIFDATDVNLTVDSVDAPQEVAVQGDEVVITEMMNFSLGFSGTYEYIEVHNYSDGDVGLTRFDATDTGIIDTTDNLIIDGVPSVVPAHSTRIIAPDGSPDDFLCEWNLSPLEVIFVAGDTWEFLTDTNRFFLFGEGGVMVDAIDTLTVDFEPAPDDGSSLDILQNAVTDFDTLINDAPEVWTYSDSQTGRRISNTLGDVGSPGYVHILDQEFDPEAPCIGECCLQDGVTCEVVSEATCVGELNGIFLFEDGNCETNPPTCDPVPTGACCTALGTCLVDISEFDCLNLGGNYQGDGAECPPECPAGPGANVKINEVWADDPSTDDAEFIELFGDPNASLAGLSLIVVDGDTAGDTNASNYRAVNLQFDFTGADVLDADGYYVLGSGTTPNVDRTSDADGDGVVDDVQNGSQTYALVPTELIEFCVNSQVCPEVDEEELTQDSVDAITVNAIDLVATTDDSVGDHVYFEAPLVKDGDFAADHMYRCPNGGDTDSTTDWLVSFGNELGDPEDASTAGSENCPIGTTLCPTPADCDGDANGDGLVDPLDTGAILARFGQDATDPLLCQYDVNCDQVIDPLDAGYVLARFGTCNAVPECELP